MVLVFRYRMVALAVHREIRCHPVSPVSPDGLVERYRNPVSPVSPLSPLSPLLSLDGSSGTLISGLWMPA
jgi:hypothetical protein